MSWICTLTTRSNDTNRQENRMACSYGLLWYRHANAQVQLLVRSPHNFTLSPTFTTRFLSSPLYDINFLPFLWMLRSLSPIRNILVGLPLQCYQLTSQCRYLLRLPSRIPVDRLVILNLLPVPIPSYSYEAMMWNTSHTRPFSIGSLIEAVLSMVESHSIRLIHFCIAHLSCTLANGQREFF